MSGWPAPACRGTRVGHAGPLQAAEAALAANQGTDVRQTWTGGQGRIRSAAGDPAPI
ncbi:hypothetical protein BDI4_110015 [Burkholderia diffusa]|nr:hypothetical protein BDI4_110015 [Burkholderia diffusa]